jgi:purine-binding chemotaxis protein CheW
MPNRFKSVSPILDLSTFYIADVCCGIDILNIQEINRLNQVTTVPLAPAFVKGILNLRGQIVTVVDVAEGLGFSSRSPEALRRNVIVRFENDSFALLVDRIGDVHRAERASVQPPPANAAECQGKYFEGVLETEKELISILNLAAVLA